MTEHGLFERSSDVCICSSLNMIDALTYGSALYEFVLLFDPILSVSNVMAACVVLRYVEDVELLE